MNDLQAKVSLEGLEIAITMKKRMPLFNAERRNQAVDRLPHGDSATP